MNFKPSLPESELNKTIKEIQSGNTGAYLEIKKRWTTDEEQERILQSLIQIQQ